METLYYTRQKLLYTRHGDTLSEKEFHTFDKIKNKQMLKYFKKISQPLIVVKKYSQE